MNLTTCRQVSIRRGLFLASAVLTFSVLVPVTLRASERWETLEAIHWIENPHNSNRPGPFGELGAYQFRETTWRSYTTVPFARAIDRHASDDVAIRHYEWLRSGLVRNGVDVTVYNIALAWNGGLNAVIRGSAPAAARDYAERVTNIAQELRRAQLASLH